MVREGGRLVEWREKVDVLLDGEERLLADWLPGWRGNTDVSLCQPDGWAAREDCCLNGCREGGSLFW